MGLVDKVVSEDPMLRKKRKKIILIWNRVAVVRIILLI